MDFELSDDQVALRHAARDLLDKLAAPERVRLVGASDDRFDRDLWTSMVEQGWLAIELAEDDGGLGLGMVETAVLLEEIGRHVAPVPYLPTVLAAQALHDAGERDLAAALAVGERIGAVAWHGDPVVAGPLADVIVCVGDDDDGLRLVEAPGISAEPAMDVTRPVGWLRDVAGGREIGDADAARRLVDRAAVGTSAELLGAAARVLELTADYAKDRIQFGKPIGSFQAVKHRCADMLVDVEAMRSAVYWAAWCIAAGHEDASIAASTAKAWCADAAKRVMASGLQVHGGIGFTWEHDLHLFLKRSQLDQVAYGDATFHRDRLAGLLRERVQAGESVV